MSTRPRLAIVRNPYPEPRASGLPRAILLLLTGLLVASCSADAPTSNVTTDLHSALTLSDPLQRVERISEVLKHAEHSDLQTILDIYEGERLRLDVASASLLAIWWTRFDPQAAFEQGLTSHLVDGPTWAGAVIREWARHSPDRAAEAVQIAFSEQDGPNWHRTLTLALVGGWLDHPELQTDALMEFLRLLPPGRPQKEALDLALGRILREHGTEIAVSVVEGLPGRDSLGHDPFKVDAFNRLATRLAVDDPARAILWAAQHENGPYGHDLTSRIARRWSRDDPKAALEWILSRVDASDPLDDEPDRRGQRERTIGAIARVWSANDPAGMTRWLDDRPLSDSLAPLFRASILHEVRRGDPRGAIARIEERARGPLRDDLLIDAGRAWVRLHPADAEVWLAEGHLPAAIQEKIRDANAAPPTASRQRPAS